LCPTAFVYEERHLGGTGELSLFIELMTSWAIIKRQESGKKKKDYLGSIRSNCDLLPALQSSPAGSGWNYSPSPQASA